MCTNRFVTVLYRTIKLLSGDADTTRSWQKIYQLWQESGQTLWTVAILAQVVGWSQVLDRPGPSCRECKYSQWVSNDQTGIAFYASRYVKLGSNLSTVLWSQKEIRRRWGNHESADHHEDIHAHLLWKDRHHEYLHSLKDVHNIKGAWFYLWFEKSEQIQLYLTI